MEKESNYTIQLLDKSSKKEVSMFLELLQSNFRKSTAYYTWKHNLNSLYEIEEYTFCIFYDNLCIATLQVIINLMKISGEKYRFALLSDGATHKNFRRLGLFERLLSHVNEICLNKNVFFVYGTGNEKSRKAFYKLGFEDFFTTFKATRKMRYNHPLMKVYNLFLNSFGKLALKENYGINEISIREYSEFIGNLNKDNANTFDKSENYLKWRLAETTGKYHVYGTFDENQELQAIVVVKMSKGLLYIVDINYNEDVSYIHKLLKFIRSLAIKNNKITRINCIHNNFKNLNKVFKSNNFQITKNKSSALIFILKSDFEISQYELDNMHYMRIDKNE